MWACGYDIDDLVACMPCSNLIKCVDTGASEAARGQLLSSLQLLTQLASHAGPGIARALLAADTVGVVRQLWLLAHTEPPVLQALLSLLTSLGASGEACVLIITSSMGSCCGICTCHVMVALSNYPPRCHEEAVALHS